MQQIKPRDLAAKLEEGHAIYLVDVRQPWENELAALPDSVLIPLNDLLARRDEIEPPQDSLVIVYCHHGIRSLSGAALLGRMGFENVFSLAGGIDAWSLQVDPKMPRY